ncbi:MULTISPECIES: hypothetical protein [unclassified Bradyrhizobium]|uniref:hypothetical protein n=1 Tax=unclassified Bradyrhizobium TaxID=2631580 RepID=UPI00291640EB|nr:MULTISPECIES: hypothetical protein [unclassified Bradyrhizobium]
MPITHQFQSGRGDNGDPGAVQPSHWDAPHALSGTLALLDAVAVTPNVVFTIDGQNKIALAAIASFAPTYSPQLAGAPTAPTAAQTVNSTQIATTEYVRTAITNVVGGAPGALDTLKELADAINDDASYAATVTAALGVRLRVDVPQGLNPAQKSQAVSNLGLAAVAVSGNYADLAGRPSLGTAAGLNVGTGANGIVQLDSNAKLPPVDGSQLTGVLPAGAVLYANPQALSEAQRLQAIANLGMVHECGRLLYSGATSLSYKPFKGDLHKINGQVYRIPAAGIAGLSNTGVYVNGVAGQNLAPNTLYYVYDFVSGGVLTGEFSTTPRATSATVGNVGTEIKNGDDSRSLIGLIYTNASAQFTSALVASWFNRRTRALSGALLSSVNSPGGYFQEIGGGASLGSPGARCYFLVWADENTVQASTMANVSCTDVSNLGMQLGYAAIGAAAAAVGPSTVQYQNTANNQCVSAVTSLICGEGVYYATMLGGHNAGSCTYSGQVTVSGISG